MRALKTILLLSVLFLVPACGERPLLPTPPPTPIPVPSVVLAVRDAALAQVRTYFSARAPAAALTWSARVVSLPRADEPLLCTLETEGWTMLVRLDGCAADLPVQVTLDSNPAAWHWSIALGADLALRELNLNVADEALAVCDAVLSFLAQRHADIAPPVKGVAWVGERTTPEGAADHESVCFVAVPWRMTLRYGLVPPERRSYHLTLDNEDSGDGWEGLVTPSGDIFEVRR